MFCTSKSLLKLICYTLTMSQLLIQEDKTGEITIQDKLSEDFGHLLESGNNADISFIVKEDDRVEKIPGELKRICRIN